MSVEQTLYDGTAAPAAVRADPREAHRFHTLVEEDEDGGYSAVVLNLPPGIGGCGATPEEALDDARDAIHGVLEVYADAGDAIPWRDTSGVAIPVGAVQKWIIVNG